MEATPPPSPGSRSNTPSTQSESHSPPPPEAHLQNPPLPPPLPPPPPPAVLICRKFVTEFQHQKNLEIPRALRLSIHFPPDAQDAFIVLTNPENPEHAGAFHVLHLRERQDGRAFAVQDSWHALIWARNILPQSRLNFFSTGINNTFELTVEAPDDSDSDSDSDSDPDPDENESEEDLPESEGDVDVPESESETDDSDSDSDSDADPDPDEKESEEDLPESEGDVDVLESESEEYDENNDGPELVKKAYTRKADIGLAMGIQGTEAAKESSDIEGVPMWEISVYPIIHILFQFQRTVNVAALILNVVSATFSGKVPLSAVQLLWVNLIMATLGALALAIELLTDHLMCRPPVRRSGRKSCWYKNTCCFCFQTCGETLTKFAGAAGVLLWIIPSFENSAWSIMAISFISLLAMSAVLATCSFVRRQRIRREWQLAPYVREFHGMSSRLVKAKPSLSLIAVLEDNCTSQTCAICLEDYNVGDKLRILFYRHRKSYFAKPECKVLSK